MDHLLADACADASPKAVNSHDPEAHVARLREMVDAELRRLPIPAEPAALYDPVRYVLAGGGKRLRPLLLLLATEAAGGSAHAAMPAALATEVFHNFTLVHDDIMDNASERRGRPTVHVVWNDSTAILAGDLMMGLAYDLLAQTSTGDLKALVQVFYSMVARVCEGQALDEAFETRTDVTVEDYLDMISRKTGALLVATMELGGMIASAPAPLLNALIRAGYELGRAFQIQDDLLDLTADDPSWGKVIGGDLIEGKKTFLLLRSLESAQGENRDWLERIVRDGGLAADHVPEARARMEALGVVDEARRAVRHHSAAGVEALRTLPPTPARESMLWLAMRLSSRAS
jgi:geranylgeranyl diphosphate synthase, type II